MICGRFIKSYLSASLAIWLALPLSANASAFHADPFQASADMQETQNPAVQTGGGVQSTPPPVSQTQSSPQQQEKPNTPLGTAAAPDTRPDGVPASAPSGAAIAPAKQKRVRKFSIRTALVVGALVAVGVVAGVTLATSARP